MSKDVEVQVLSAALKGLLIMLKEAPFGTDVCGALGFYTVKMYFTEKVDRGNINDLAYCSAIGGNLPYLFSGCFYKQKENLYRWYFSNSTRHEDLRMVVEKDIGRTDLDYVYGQIWFTAADMTNGELLFSRLNMNQKIPNVRARRKLLSSIDEDCLSKNFVINDWVAI